MTIFIVILIALAYYVEKWSLKRALEGIEFDYSPSKLLAAPGEEFQVITTISNKSRRFVPFLRMEEHLPEELVIHGEGISVRKDVRSGLIHASTVYLTPRSKLERSIQVSLPARGRYMFNGAQLSGGDFLGISEKSRKAVVFAEIVVYPKEADESYVVGTVGAFLGDLSVRRFIIEDPVLTVGFREYTGREPMKTISWSQSARMGRLMVKSFDYTTEPSVTVLLNVEHKEGEESLVEYCYSMAHTVCRILEGRGIKYDFFTNATTAGALAQWSYVAEGLGERHFLTILEGLGRASYRCTETFEAVLGRVKAGNQVSRGLIIITPSGVDIDQAARDMASPPIIISPPIGKGEVG